jgi:uncharacterized phage protein (predicted DNA packaging)
MAMLDDVKDALRLSGTDLDTEVSDLISAARQDLILSGVLSSIANVDNNALVKRAIILYSKTHFGWDNPEAVRFQTAYDTLKRHLTLSEDFTVAP